MRVISTELDGVVIIEPELHGDSRGYFFESFSQRDFDSLVSPTVFVQDNESRSSYGVIRGLHYQCGDSSQGKLVRAVLGKAIDVAVDIRRGSPTFGKHVAVELSGENHRQLFIPRGFAHGFSVLSESLVLQYKCDRFYDPNAERGIAWDDPELGIDWRIPAGSVIVSEKDSHRPRLGEAEDLFVWESSRKH